MAKTVVAAVAEERSEKVMLDEAAREERNPVPKERTNTRPTFADKFKVITTRPEQLVNKRGASGQVIPLMTNFITVKRQADDIVVQYQVAFEPINLTNPQKFRLIRQWADSVRLVSSDYTFDRSNILYVGPKGFAKLGEEVRWTGTTDGAPVDLRVFRVATLDPKNPSQFVQILVQLNTQLNRFMEQELKMVRVMDTCFDPNRKIIVQGQPIEIWPGFDASIGKYDSDTLLMSIDQRFRIIRRETALQVIQGTFMGCKSRGLPDGDCQVAATKAIKGSVIETPYNHIAYKVDGVDWTKTPVSTFPTRRKGSDGIFTERLISYAEYFKERYNHIVRDSRQPMLLVKPSNKAMRRKRDDVIMLIPELCNMTGLTDKMKADFRLMKAVANHTKLGPEPRRGKNLEFVAQLSGDPVIQEKLKSWGTSYGTELVKAQGRTLNALPIFQGDRKIPDYQRADWLTGIRSSRADHAGPTVGSNWLCLHFGQDQVARNFVRELCTVSGPMGQNLGEPKFIEVGGNTATHFLNAAMANGNASIALVMAIFPDNSVDRYSAFKSQFCCTAPCITQVMLLKTISEAKSLKSVATKVAMQIIAKIGGRIWKMRFPFTAPTTIIGIDVHRDRTEKKLAVAACASWNKDMSGYMNFSDFANEDDDVHGVVAKLLKTAVEKFKEPNGTYPHHVLLYRDGVSEGQLPNIVGKEVKMIHEMLLTVPAQKPITLTYVMVNKRDSTRFFCNPNTNGGNPPPGTVVDDVVTRPFRYDFFIVSQTVREGTVAPTYYDVIEDELKMTPEAMQICTYQLCHMYFNWPGTIRVPAPNQYARKHAQLVAVNLHRKVADSLCNKMPYL